jgi:hypothetical protein
MDLLYFDRPSQHIQVDSKVIKISVDITAKQVHLPFLLPFLPLLKKQSYSLLVLQSSSQWCKLLSFVLTRIRALNCRSLFLTPLALIPLAYRYSLPSRC